MAKVTKYGGETGIATYVDGQKLVIEVDVDVLEGAFNHSFEVDGEFEVKRGKTMEFAEFMARALLCDFDVDGSNFVHVMLDAVFDAILEGFIDDEGLIEEVE